jgi:hypothetical protein
MKDGLYRVVTYWFVAGFVMRRGAVVRCAPILARRLNYWIEKGEWIAP